MKKLHTLAFYVLVTPVITLSSAALFAQQPNDQGADRDDRSSQYERDDKQSTSKTDHGDKNTQRTGKSDARTGADHQQMGGQSHKQNRGFMSAAPTNGMQASNLIGAEVGTSADENVGEVNDLIIDDNGQVVAISVSVGGFLGMGERDVAIGWDDVTRTGDDDELKLQIDATRESLRSAPEFERQD